MESTNAKVTPICKYGVTNGESIVVVVIGYRCESASQYFYKAFPVLGNTFSTRVLVHYPIITRAVEAASDRQAIKAIKRVIKRSHIVYNNELRSNLLIWNGKFSGFINELPETDGQLTKYSAVSASVSYDDADPVIMSASYLGTYLKNWYTRDKEYGNLLNTIKVVLYSATSNEFTEETCSIEFME